MPKIKAAFSGFSVNDLAKSNEFYTKILGLKVDDEGMGLRLYLPDGATVFVYPKNDHQPATFTILNFVVENIDEAVCSFFITGDLYKGSASLYPVTGTFPPEREQ